MKLNFKKLIPHLVAIGIFLLLVCIYFSPSIFEGKVIQQGDSIHASGMSHELDEYYEKEGGKSAWTGSMFSGMPSYHIYVHGNPPNFLKWLEKPIKVLDYMGGSMTLTALICFYILMCIMGVNRWLSIAGSIAYAFASFNIIIIMAGHVTQMYVIAYMPLMIAGMILLFRKEWLWGTILSAIAITLSIINNHIQITYYLALCCVFIFLGYLVSEIKAKQYTPLLKTTGALAVAVLLAVLCNIGSLYSNYESSKESMRGPSELTAADPGEKVSSGLDIQYAFQWSYDTNELLTLLIPNVYGGSSNEALGKDTHLYKTYKALGAQVGKEVHASTYWGDQPFTSGPVYLGAVVCFLFVLGMFVVRNPMKWWLLAATVFFCILSLGKHAEINEFFFHHLPMYNKFRVPSMALVIPGLIFPIIGFWGLKEVFAMKENYASLKKPLLFSTAITGGICLIIWLMPGLFLNFSSPFDEQYQQFPPQVLSALLADRQDMASADALRSLIFILLAAGALYYFIVAKNKQQSVTIISIALIVLMLADLVPVAKRYLNDDHFSSRKLKENFQPTAADNAILRDTSPSYRVANLTKSTFRDASTSYFHKSIGGYHAAKLRRYQELIDARLQPELIYIQQEMQKATSFADLENLFQRTPSLNMLNTKYFIFHPEQPPLVNQYADGNAWFVSQVKMVNSADEELAALNTIDPKETAVVDKRFAGLVTTTTFSNDSTDYIKLLTYKPNYLIYESNSASNGLAVFSEIYYADGWKAFIDGKPAEHFRADWVLRAMNVPAGKHQIEFRFEPDTYNNLMKTGSIASIVVILLFIGAIALSFKKKKLQ